VPICSHRSVNRMLASVYQGPIPRSRRLSRSAHRSAAEVSELERVEDEVQGSEGERKALRRLAHVNGRARVKPGTAYFDRPDAVPFELCLSSVTSGGDEPSRNRWAAEPQSPTPKALSCSCAPLLRLETLLSARTFRKSAMALSST
jgi:hypothetical protein